MDTNTIIALSSLFWQILGTVFTGIGLYITIHRGGSDDK